ncbi:uncharacterized protein LOC127859892 isoform X1 [Dreissena polymorpha]|nr:uncharacterized protein LOC127859892 isoform X1 [Dreissena polymorpha]XP_052253439.1 uncharacterized protein LOC127859892 isoform X1 [Dreissena polymorpha]XP_052253440.1 uncharacterized protein LOC127859892 isoform X1 [Dreissena polymorpha]XP_052253441.1 uncharacterized protein LOC127859892 isoform X1 [Dreissena polymorpha]
MPLLSGLISLLGLIQLSSQSDNNLKLVSVATDWESAQNNCIHETRILISEMPSVISLANVKPGDVIWVNAKVTRIEYHGGKIEYSKLAYMPSEKFLENCICVSKIVNDSGTRTCTRTKTAINWTEAHQKCTFNGETWDPLPSHRIKQTLAMLEKGPSVWLSKYPSRKIEVLDETVSKCVCLQRLEGGSFVERLDNCSSSHRYVCAKDRDNHAPTLTRLETLIPELSINGDANEENISDLPGSNGNVESKMLIGAIAGGVAGCIVIVIAAAVAVYVCRRYHRRRQYRQSLRRFQNKQTNRSTNTLPRASDLDKGRSLTLDSSVVQGKIKYEDCTGKKYATLQGEVARECKGRLNRQGYVNEIEPNIDSIEDLEKYEEFSPSCNNVHTLEPGQEVYENTRLKKASIHTDEKAFDNSAEDDCYVEKGKPILTKKTRGAKQQPEQATLVTNDDSEYGRVKLNYDIPPRRQKGQFGLKFCKAAGNKQRAIATEFSQKQREGQEDEVSQDATLDDLDEYENFNTLERNQRAVIDLNKLESYENFAKQQKHSKFDGLKVSGP